MTDFCIFCFKKQPLKVNKKSVNFNWKLTISELFKLSIDFDLYLTNRNSEGHFVCSECTHDLKIIDKIHRELNILNEKLQQVRAGFELKIVQSQGQAEIHGQDGGGCGGASLDEPFDSGVFEIRNMIFECIQERNSGSDLPSADADDVEIEINENENINLDDPSPFHDNDDVNVNTQTDEDENQNEQDKHEQDQEESTNYIIKLKDLTVLLEPIPLQKFDTETSTDLNETPPFRLGPYNVKDQEIVKFISDEKVHLARRISRVSIKNSDTKRRQRNRKNPKAASLLPESIRMLRFSKKKEFKCSVCQQNFSGKNPYLNLKQHYLWKHTAYNKELLEFPCTICSRTFFKKFKLKNHLNKVHPLTWKNGNPAGHLNSYSCSICQKSFASMGSLSRHHKRDHGLEFEKPLNFKCKTCGSKFSSNYKLNVHMRKHSNVRSHLCQFCTVSYKSEISLKNHILLAHGEDPTFDCIFEKCSRKFLTSKLLDDHVKERHENQVRFVCPKCGLGFYDERKLKLHIYYHPDNLRYSCDFCHKRYAKPDRLAEHIYSHNKERGLAELSCEHCEATFKCMASRKRHIKNFHSSSANIKVKVKKVRKVKKSKKAKLEVCD